MGILKSIFSAKENFKNRKVPIIHSFPAFDIKGNKALKIRRIKLSGSAHVHYGEDPQKIIKYMIPGEQLYLYPDPDNKYDKTAVAVFTSDKHYIGWIPSGSNKTIFDKLMGGESVYTRFVEKDIEEVIDYNAFHRENGYDTYGSATELLQYTTFYDSAVIEVQTYSKAQK